MHPYMLSRDLTPCVYDPLRLWRALESACPLSCDSVSESEGFFRF
jgi:hypothetical protein